MTRFRPTLMLGLLVLGCDPEIVAPDGGGGSGGDGGADTIGGWTACESPNIRLCGGPDNCPEGNDCGCFDVPGSKKGLAWCTADTIGVDFSNCNDGTIMFENSLCLPWELGMLICNAGEPEILRYVDGVPFDCKPLPQPDECAETTDLPLCGDSCGPCSSTSFCTARTQLHPFGFCAPTARDNCRADLPCPDAERCFFYNSSVEGQDFADKNGMCLPLALCEAAAAELPGGGRCEETAE